MFCRITLANCTAMAKRPQFSSEPPSISAGWSWNKAAPEKCKWQTPATTVQTNPERIWPLGPYNRLAFLSKRSPLQLIEAWTIF